MPKCTEYVLYKTREKAVSLSGLLASDESPPVHFYILVAAKDLAVRDEDDEGLPERLVQSEQRRDVLQEK